MTSFAQRIDAMNLQYELPVPGGPTFELGEAFNTRIRDFINILFEEIEEGPEIIIETDPLAKLTALADWLGDIIIYCYSEAARHGIPIENVLSIIMDSNASKLGADGKPIKDIRGKFLKGPNYWKPEPKIAELLATMLEG